MNGFFFTNRCRTAIGLTAWTRLAKYWMWYFSQSDNGITFANSFQSFQIQTICTFQVCKWHFIELFAINNCAFFVARQREKHEASWRMKKHRTKIEKMLHRNGLLMLFVFNLFSLILNGNDFSICNHEHALLWMFSLACSASGAFRTNSLSLSHFFYRSLPFPMAIIHSIHFNDILNLWKFFIPARWLNFFLSLSSRNITFWLESVAIKLRGKKHLHSHMWLRYVSKYLISFEVQSKWRRKIANCIHMANKIGIYLVET